MLMRILRLLVALMVALVFVVPLSIDTKATVMSVKRLTAWNMEKKSATATAGLTNLVVEGVGGQITALRIEPSTLQVKKLVNIYSPGSLSGPSWAPGAVEVISEPRLPRYGDWVYVIARSGGIRYIMSIHVTGGGVKFYRIPDTQIGDVKFEGESGATLEPLKLLIREATADGAWVTGLGDIARYWTARENATVSIWREKERCYINVLADGRDLAGVTLRVSFAEPVKVGASSASKGGKVLPNDRGLLLVCGDGSETTFSISFKQR